MAKLIDAIPADRRTAIRQIAKVTGHQNITAQVAGSANQVNLGPRS